MKRRNVILCGSVLAVVLSACGNGETAVGRTDPNNANSVEAVLQQQMAAEEAPQPTVEIVVENPAEDAIPEDFGAEAWEMTGEPDASVDVDLTVLNSNMVYAEVYNMMTQPQEYLGKSIKMRGAYNVFQDESTGQIYYTCIIQDATACCAQGIEFIPEDMDAFKAAEYASGDEIMLEGEFNVYPDGQYMYAVLTGAEIFSE